MTKPTTPAKKTKRCQAQVYLGMGNDAPCGRKATHYSATKDFYCCAEHAVIVYGAKKID